MKLYISHRCFLCRVIEPIVKAIAQQYGEGLSVWKLGRDGIARQVNGSGEERVAFIPALPALAMGREVIVGAGIAQYLFEKLKGNHHGESA